MNKVALAESLQETLGGTKAEAERAVEAVFNTIASELTKGEDVSIAGFGIFSAKLRAARTARNPRTGEPIQVPEMRVPKFKAGKALKESVRGNA